MNAVFQNHYEIAKILLKRPDINVNIRGVQNFSALCLLKELLKIKGIDVNIYNDSFTPLHLAVSSNNIENVKSLLNHPNIDINLIDKISFKTPLQVAQDFHRVEISQILSEYIIKNNK